MTQLQTKQLRQVRDNAVQLAELKTQMLELRRSYDDAGGNRLQAGSSASSSSSATAEGSSGGPSALVATTSSSSATAASSSSSSASTGSSLRTPNIKPRTATIILKRRLAEADAAMAVKQAKRQLSTFLLPTDWQADS